MEEENIKKIEWTVPEYKHKEKNIDWYWAIGLTALVACIVALYFNNYLFAVFIIVSGASLILFSFSHPQDLTFVIDKKGFSMGKDLYPWKNIKSFNIKDKEDADHAKLLIETNKYFLPIYTIFLPKELLEETKETLIKIIPRSEIDESKSMIFMEKIGF